MLTRGPASGTRAMNGRQRSEERATRRWRGNRIHRQTATTNNSKHYNPVDINVDDLQVEEHFRDRIQTQTKRDNEIEKALQKLK